MPKTKTKSDATIGDFTDAIRAGNDWVDTRVIIAPGERDARKQLNTRRRPCPALLWGWLSEEQRAMLVLLEQAALIAGYGHVRSCLAAPSGADGATAERRLFRRQRYDAMRAACRDQAALNFTLTALSPPDRECFDNLTARLIGGPRAKARAKAHDWIAATAGDLLAWRAAGERLQDALPCRQ